MRTLKLREVNVLAYIPSAQEQPDCTEARASVAS